MWLIDTATLELHYFAKSDQHYAILSHTWGSTDEEVTYQEMAAPARSEQTTTKHGYQKIVQTCEIAREDFGLAWAWVDTCCIDKSSSAELSEAINSMFRWYQDAKVCFAYLRDANEHHSTFQQSRWFTRGWTLQELIAPEHLIFFDRHWKSLGTKDSLKALISSITGTPTKILDKTAELEGIPVAVRFSWASMRETTREEDLAYCLLGIFHVNIPMLDGEGMRAFIRLEEAILAQSSDMSLFLWHNSDMSQLWTGILAPSPRCFRNSAEAVAKLSFGRNDFYLTNRGIRFKLGLSWNDENGLAILSLEHRISPNPETLGIYLRRVGVDLFVRGRQMDFCVPRADRFPAVFTVVKALTESQSEAIASNTLHISIAPDIKSGLVEPQGSWQSNKGRLYGGYTSTFLGYMPLIKENYPLIALVYCLRRGIWTAGVFSGERWTRIQHNFYERIQDQLSHLALANPITVVELGRIYSFNNTEAMTVQFRCGNEDQRPCVLVATETVAKKRTSWFSERSSRSSLGVTGKFLDRVEDV